MSVVPASNGGRHGVRVGKPHPLQRRQRRRVVLDAREHQAAEARGQRLLGGKELAVAGVDALQRASDRRIELAQRFETRQRRHAPPVGVSLRQLVGLLVGQHLHSMLDITQAHIGLGQFLAGLRGHVPGLGQRGERLQGPAAAKLRIAAAQDQLLGLDVELDLPDAARAQLEIDALGRHPLVDLVRVDLALDGMDVGDGGEVEVLAPDEGLELGEERLGRGHVAGAGARLDEGRPLPVLADILVVLQRRGDRHRRLGRGRIGPQPQVHPEDVAVGGAQLHQVRQPLRQPHGEGLALDAGRQRHPVRIEEHRDVDVAGIVELEGALFAHGDAEPAGDRPFRAFAQPRQPPGLKLALGGHDQRRRHRRVGEAGERAGHLVQIPDAAQVAERGQQVQLRLQLAQAFLAAGQIETRRLGGARQQRLQPGVRLIGQQGVEPRRVAPRQACQIGRG